MKRYKKLFKEDKYLKGEYDRNFSHLSSNVKEKLENLVIDSGEYSEWEYNTNVYDMISDMLLDFPKIEIPKEVKQYIKKISFIDFYYSTILGEYIGRFLIKTNVGDLYIEQSFSKYNKEFIQHVNDLKNKSSIQKIDFNKFIKPIKANYKTGSPYGLITPSFILKLKGKSIHLPKEYEEFINFLNENQPKTLKDIDSLESEFLRLKK